MADGNRISLMPAATLTNEAILPVVIEGRNYQTTLLALQEFLDASGIIGDPGPGYYAVSTTSFALGTGSKTFTVQEGLAYVPGCAIRVMDTANPTVNYMDGTVTAYSTDQLTIDVGSFNGTGTLANWTFVLGGSPGPKGDTGASGSNGTNGTNGAAALMTIGTVSTLSPGASATASVTGSAPNFALNLGIPAGATGASGSGSGDVVSNTSTSVANELALFTDTTGKSIKRATTTGILKGASGVLSAATSGTDYLAPPSGTALLKANSGGALANAAAGTDYLAPPSGTALLKANSGGALANAAAGTDYQAPIGTISGVAKGNGANALTAATAGTDYMHPGTTSTLTKGFNATPNNLGTVSTGTTTPDPANGNFQYYVNGGAHTLAPPASDCSIVIQSTNNGSAGAITVSGFTKTSGDSRTTVNGDDFLFFITRLNGFSHLHVQALQ